jgi:hypothetical protein
MESHLRFLGTTPGADLTRTVSLACADGVASTIAPRTIAASP